MNLYRIRHLTFSIDDPAGDLRTQADRLLGMFQVAALASDESVHMRLNVSRRSLTSQSTSTNTNESLPCVWEGILDGLFFRIFRSGSERRLEVPDQATLEFDIKQGWARLNILNEVEPAVKAALLLRLISESLTHDGSCFIHAACLAMPRGNDWVGVMLCAPSNTGKSTTSLALANSGWRLLGDDMTYVKPANRGSGIWGFPRSCHIRPGTLRLMPWLESCRLGKPSVDGVRTLDLDALESRAWTNAPWLTPKLVVILASHNSVATRVEKIDRVGALCQIASDSINAISGICDEDAASELSTLGRLVCTVPTCRLSVGPDLEKISGQLQCYLNAIELPSFGHETAMARSA